MIERQLASELAALTAEYPVVTVLGPRQAGKTTLVRHQLPDYRYVNLELPDVREFAREDPRAFLAEHRAPVIFDEIQRVPDLLSYIQVEVDETGDNGQFVLTGSHQLELRAAISQSLAGRTALLTLYPLSISELIDAGTRFDGFAECLLQGFLPRIHDTGQRASTAFANYYRTYLERDVRQLIMLRDAALFEKFVKLLAGRVGQLVNHQSLGNDVGVDGKTIREWLSVLEASFIVFRLPPYFENFGKRAIKSPKYYFTEPGLLCWLLELREPAHVRRDPLVGSLFENLVVVEALKSRANRGEAPNLYFYRDNHGLELDLLFQQGSSLTGLEVKSAATLHAKFKASLLRFDSKVAPLARKLIVHDGDDRRWSDGVRAANWRDVDSLVSSSEGEH